ncbi:Acyltransferase family protein [Trichomonas vaginalis G3]|uniref:Acyltransferase family protein n=1 Tax=Trichomonas vaginalis (strain ATCC PRA-98 / G3) TaxID=412133 RepID=A2D7J8_TRIV3|nr:1-alkylglycerophosphocholine O-acetyltransferase protein [Trichomonas vaginalis G3]EAY23715.1 Acyltransferase family protein [Trichomonas vaginalis G3]KAI5490210.1 1-alkylglycerophosphocholine O-acetyltransferase protein [Trichomonas vaginalis G3]|eukprot:XP_001276963.1 Acyltransferase family protein [Trichomonas vaginalis G3]
MKLYTNVPIDDSKLHDQKLQSEITDEEFQALFAVHELTRNQKIIRFVFWLVTLGLIRFILTCLFLLVFDIMMQIVVKYKDTFKTPKEFKKWAHNISKPVIRTVLFLSGIVHIKKVGEIDPEARAIISNHITMIDIVNILYWVPFTIVAHTGLRGNPFIEHCAAVFDTVFVDRSKTQGATQQISDYAEDPTRLPVVVFPEGKVTNGDALLAFRTGIFVSGVPIQPITIRYRSWLPFFDGQQTPSWLEDNVFMYFYQLYAIPFMTFEIHFLPTIHSKRDETKPADRAIQAQLAMANDLGCLAIDRTNKEIFQKPKTE